MEVAIAAASIFRNFCNSYNETNYMEVKLMITALKIFYVVGGVAFYYYKTELEPKVISQNIELYKDTIFEKFDFYSKTYKVEALIGSIVWPIFLTTNFACVIAGFIWGLLHRE